MRIEAPNGDAGIPLSVRFAVFERDGFRCIYCGNGPSDGVKLELDHAVSVMDGGADTEDNLVTACAPCNRGKGALSVLSKKA